MAVIAFLGLVLITDHAITLNPVIDWDQAVIEWIGGSKKRYISERNKTIR